MEQKNEKRGIFKNHEEVWVEKYRPRTFDDLICDKEIKQKLISFVKNQDVSNLLLEGPAGTGKSSIANLLVKEIDCDFKEINASNDNGIEAVRTIIMQFCMTASFSKIKIMVLSEFSEFTPQGQGALRDIMEKFSSNTRFIMTCNSVDRIIEPIRSRAMEFKIIPPSKDKVYERCAFVLKNEGVEYDDLEMRQTVDFNYPDVRKCIQSLEQQTIDKVLKLNKEFFKLLKHQEKIIELCKTVNEENVYLKVKEVRQLLSDAKVKNYTQLYRYLFDKIDDYCPKNKVVKVIITLEEGLKYDSFIADKEINVIATIIKIFELLSTK